MKNIKVIHKIASTILVAVFFATGSLNAFAVNENTNFEVNVKETLSVSITTPTSWANGSLDQFLRNLVSVSVTSNNSAGFTATMYSANNTTNLTNTASSSTIIPTLSSSSARSSFPANYWGYSLGEYTLNGVNQSSYTLNGNSYGETLAGNDSSNYYPLISSSASPITIIDGSTVAKSSGTQNIYFGAKANATKASGTYIGTVIISVVSGVVDNNTNPVTPVNPVNPTGDEVATYHPSPVGNSTSGATSYTYRSTNTSDNTTTATTEVSSGDNRSSYTGYTPPQGVILDINKGQSGLVTGLGIATSIAMTSGMIFFIVAKRKEDDEEEEDQQQ